MKEKQRNYDLYVVAQTNYKNMHKDLKDSELFPAGWYTINNLYVKNNILIEAIKNKILVKDTVKYKEYNSDIRFTK